MAIIELSTYDLMTAPTAKLFTLQGFWANLASQGAKSARLLCLADKLDYQTALQGFDQVAVPFHQLPRDVRWYRSYYEQYLRETIQETKYIRVFLIMPSVMGEQTLRQLIENNGIRTKPLGREGVPLPFTRATPHWDVAESESGEQWGVIESKLGQTGGVLPQMLHKLFSLEFPTYLAIDIWNYERREAIQMMRTKTAVAQVTGLSQKTGREAKIQAGETQQAIDQFRREMGRIGVSLHEVRLRIAVGANSNQELQNRFELIRGSCPFELERHQARIAVLGEMFSAQPPQTRQGTLATTNHVTILTSSALSYSRPTRTDGVLAGFDNARAPVVINIFDRANSAYNMVVIGQTGAGKTFFTNLLMSRSLFTGVRLIIFDPKGDIDYSWLGKDNQGGELCQTVRVGQAGNSLNILTPIFPEMNNQMEFVLGGLRLLEVYQKGETLKKSVLDRALHTLYGEWDWQNKNEQPAPLLKALLAEVEQIGQEASGRIQEAAQEVAFALEKYAIGSRAYLFGQPTNVDVSLTAPVTIFDVSAFPSRQTGEGMRSMLFATLMGLMNEAIVQKRKSGADRAHIQWFVDEIGVLMRDEVVADFVSDKYKTARSLGVSMIVADQTLASLLGPQDEHGVHHGHEMFSNAPFRFIFYQPGNEAGRLAEMFPMMPTSYRERIHHLMRGQCVAQTPDGTYQINVIPSELEKVVFSSRQEDKTRAQQLISQMRQELEAY